MEFSECSPKLVFISTSKFLLFFTIQIKIELRNRPDIEGLSDVLA